MDKNVSGVDLEELRKAREELDRERGVETDPNLYNDYKQNRETQSQDESEKIEPVEQNISDEIRDSLFTQQKELIDVISEKEEEAVNTHTVDPDEYVLYKKYLS